MCWGFSQPGNDGDVRSDSSAIGGFFEDLPVLVIVVSGFLVLASAATWASGQLTESRDSAQLSELAHRLSDAVLAEILQSQVPSIRSLAELNMSQLAESSDMIDALVTILEIYPRVLYIVSQGEGPSEVNAPTGFSREYFNAITDEGLVAPMELRVIVWWAQG